MTLLRNIITATLVIFALCLVQMAWPTALSDLDLET